MPKNESIDMLAIPPGWWGRDSLPAERELRARASIGLVLGLVVFVLGMAGVISLGKIMVRLFPKSFSPTIGAAGGISVSSNAWIERHPEHRKKRRLFLPMPALRANMVGVIGSVAAGGFFLLL